MAWRGLGLLLVAPMLPDAAATEAVNLGHQSRWPGEIGITALILAIGSVLAVYIYRTTARFRQQAAESRRTEDALRKSEERIRLLLNSTGEAIYGIDTQGNCTFANSACMKILGYADQDALLGKNMHRLIHHSYPDGRPMPVEVCKIYQAFHENKGTHVDDEMLWRADGTRFPAEYWSFPQSMNGQVYGAVVTFVDITERKQAESYREMGRDVLHILNQPGEMQDAIQRVLAVVKTRTGVAAVGIRLQDGEDFPYFTQDGFSTAFLQQETSLLERTADGAIFRNHNGKVRLECTCGLVISGKTDPASPLFTRGGSFWSNDALSLRDLPSAQDPRHHPRNQCMHHGYASLALIPIRNQERIVGLIHLGDRRKGSFTREMIELLEGIASHLGEALMRTQAERALQVSEERYALTLEAVNDGVWDWDIPTGAALFSPNYYALLGYDNGEFPASYASWRLLVHPEDLDRVEAKLRLSIASGKGFTIDLRMKSKSGPWRWVAIRGRVVQRDAEEKVLRMVGTLSDISERKQAETEMAELALQNQQLQKAESLGRMAGAIAHRLNNQLQVVMGNLELGMDDLPRNAEPFATLSIAMQAARHAAEVSQSMLTYLGQTSRQRTPLDLAQSCRQLLPVLTLSLPNGVALTPHLPDPGPIIAADADQIQQVVTQLLTNAWEASAAGGGTIRLTVKTVTPAEIPAAQRFPVGWRPQAAAYACVEVADAGGGIAPDDLEKIFDPFFSRKFTGRGMGLAITLGLVRAHEGTITVENEPGHGCTIRVFLPVAEEAVAPPQKKHDA